MIMKFFINFENINTNECCGQRELLSVKQGFSDNVELLRLERKDYDRIPCFFLPPPSAQTMFLADCRHDVSSVRRDGERVDEAHGRNRVDFLQSSKIVGTLP